MKVINIKKYKGSVVLKVAICSLFVFVAGVIISQNFEISAMQSELNYINDEIVRQEKINEEIQYSVLTGQTEGQVYVERYARSELDYAKPNEKVFVNIGGN